MEHYLLLATVLFWIIYYIFQGIHDLNFIKEVKLISSELNDGGYNQIEKQVTDFEIKWKIWGSFEKGFAKIFIAVLIYLLTGNLIFSFLILLLSVFIRWFVHDLVIALGLKKGFNHIGPDYIWSDRLLRSLSLLGINQYIVKLMPLIATIILILFLIND